MPPGLNNASRESHVRSQLGSTADLDKCLGSFHPAAARLHTRVDVSLFAALRSRPHLISGTAGAFSLDVGILVLCDWVIGNTALTSPVPWFDSKKPNAAIRFVQIGGALGFSSLPDPESRSLFYAWTEGSWLWR